MKRSLLLLQVCALAVLFTWPLVPRFTSEAIGRSDTDTPKHLRNLWWMRREVWEGPVGLHTRPGGSASRPPARGSGRTSPPRWRKPARSRPLRSTWAPASVPIERLSAWSTSGDRWLRALALVQMVKNFPPGRRGADTNWRRDLWLLRDRGFTHLLITHRDSGIELGADTFVTGLCGEPVRVPQATLWAVPAVVTTATEPAEWRTLQAERIVRAR